MAKFKVGDVVSFPDRAGVGTISLVGDVMLMVDVGLGNGHDGVVGWTERLGWVNDGSLSYWFVPKSSCKMVKQKVSFKGNIK